MSAVEVTQLVKHYGAVRAVDGVSFSIEPGEVYALLGENGAGKSTTVEILEGYRQPTSGAARVLGVDPDEGGRSWRERVGIVLQTSGIEQEFSVREVFDLYGSVYSNPRPADEVIEMVGLTEKADERVGSLSGGQQRRVDLGLGIVGRPEVLFLDEPTTGFDPSARRRSWDLVEQLGAGGTTVLLTTHYLDEAEHLADRVGVLSRGVLVAEGTPGTLIEQVSGTVVSFDVPHQVELADARATFAPLLGADLDVAGRLVEARVDEPTAAVHRLTAWAVERSIELDSLSVRRASLEDAFLRLVHDAESAGDRGDIDSAADAGEAETESSS